MADEYELVLQKEYYDEIRPVKCLTKTKRLQVFDGFLLFRCGLNWMTFCYLVLYSDSKYDKFLLSTALVGLRLLKH